MFFFMRTRLYHYKIEQKSGQFVGPLFYLCKTMNATIHPANFEEKTGFDRVREMLRIRCFSSLGGKQLEKVRFSSDRSLIELQLNQCEEFRLILLSGEVFPGSNYYDPEALFKHLRPKDTFAEPETLLDLGRSLETIEKVIAFFSRARGENEPSYPWLAGLVKDLHLDASLLPGIGKIIDEKALVRSTASPALAEIRRQKRELETKASRRINQLLGEGKANGWIAQDVELALRGGRLVIPIPAGHKRKIRGFVHDQSATGQTVFLEPEEVFEINNHIHELELDERREIIRILKAFADKLRPLIPELEACYLMLGQVDLIRAKARLAVEMEAQKPRIVDGPQLQWVNARHPLLFMAYKPQKKHVEPLTIGLDNENRILVISGPNAGGKSVCLKTCGLLQYMVQCGLLVPMEDYSEAGIFEKIFIDIGDQQSIENDLSTYSSHLLNLKFFVEHSDARTLFLIDELGAGTEPRIGGALAESVMDQLNRNQAFGVVTTHYANLKLMASKHPGIVNGSMLFDTKQMKPLFRLKTGNPGSSFAFEIARTIGLPAGILDRAARQMGTQDLDFDKQLQDLEVKKLELEEKEKQLRSADAFLSEMIDKYESLNTKLETRKSEIITQARQDAKKILADANRMIERTIREIKEAEARKEQTRKARKELDNFVKEQETLPGQKKSRPRPEPAAPLAEPGPVKTGDTVRVVGQETPGEVLEISGSQAVVSFGSIKFRTPVSKLEKIRKDTASAPSHVASRTRLVFNLNEKAAAFSPETDLRGMRADEALGKLRSYLDDAILLNAKQVKILHGKGDGILRMAVREYLQTIAEVRRFRDEHADRGGAGATIVDFH
jgi:DNA mismatch repair protein MutS2